MIYYNWFAWYPVKTQDRGWVWLKTVRVFNEHIEGQDLIIYMAGDYED